MYECIFFLGQKSEGIRRGKLTRFCLEQGFSYCTHVVYSSSNKSLHRTMPFFFSKKKKKKSHFKWMCEKNLAGLPDETCFHEACVCEIA
jgi:hypothetical protein